MDKEEVSKSEVMAKIATVDLKRRLNEANETINQLKSVISGVDTKRLELQKENQEQRDLLNEVHEFIKTARQGAYRGARVYKKLCDFLTKQQ